MRKFPSLALATSSRLDRIKCSWMETVATVSDFESTTVAILLFKMKSNKEPKKRMRHSP